MNRLLELLNKPLDEYTWDDVFELERIADLMFKEACRSRRDDLSAYSGKLRVFIDYSKENYLEEENFPNQNKLKHLSTHTTH